MASEMGDGSDFALRKAWTVNDSEGQYRLKSRCLRWICVSQLQTSMAIRFPNAARTGSAMRWIVGEQWRQPYRARAAGRSYFTSVPPATVHPAAAVRHRR